MKSIDEGPFQMGTFRETLVVGNEGTLHLGPERARVYFDLSPEDKERYNANIRETNILLQRLPKDIYTLINHYTDAKDIWDNVKMLLEGLELTKEDHKSQLNDDFEHFCQNNGETIHDYYVKFITAVKLNKGLRDSDYDQLYAYLKQHEAHANENKMMLERFTQPNVDPLALMSNVLHQQVIRIEVKETMEGVQVQLVMGELKTELGMQIQMQAQENGVALDEEQLLFIAGGQDNAVDKDVDEQSVQDLALNVDNVFQVDECDAFDSDVDEAPTAQTMFMANLSSADPVFDEVGPSYDSDILSEVYDHYHYQDAVCEHHEAYEMHDDYVKDSAEPVVQNNVSSVPNDAYLMIINEMHEQSAHSVSANKQNNVVNASLTAELATYKEQVELYERRAKLELIEREQKIEEQLRIPALYNGHEIIKTNHVPAIVYNSEDTLEIAEITRKKMNDKMKTPLWTEQNINIRPSDYSKENNLATFTPQTQPTPSQIFWSKDVLKMKVEALKEQTPASRPIKALTVYPPNTPAVLVPTVLPTKSQVKINIFALIQLFSKFDKTCKKRITPTGLTEGERGFELTKKCYLTELEAEVDQNIMNRKYDEIEQKNLLIANDNLIANFLSKEVLYIVTNSELTVSRFTKMHDAHTVVQAHCLEHEAKLSKLHDKLKYQNHKESFGNNTSPPTRDAPDFDSVFITQLTEKVIVLQEQNELFRAENAKIKQHYKELYDSIKITCTKHIEQTTALLTKNENLKAQIHENLKFITRDSVKPKVHAPGRYAIDVEPIPPRKTNNREVHLDYLKHLKESVETLREIIEEVRAEKPLDSSLASACLYTKHSQELLEYMIGTCSKYFNKRDRKIATAPLIRKK
ncbi:hypothetical protein Tco_0655309 [Tanacetum coccineum]|uniref:Integrase, catalytic region, zinc finger, CCHC-type, peptidase aspartic, catalytic n=1 Tax=Tanacetum coccineum TaxID=301880 RepID=A0ABQ4X5P0_9ASTR